MTKLILVRHGSTKWTKEKRYQGTSDIPLSEEGIEQAKRVAKRLKEKRIDIIYTSGLLRAIQTAQQIPKFHNVKLVKSKELNERSYGRWEGLTKEEVKKKYPDNYAEYNKYRYKTRPIGGESFSDLRKRIELFIKNLVEQNKGKTILIVCHNGPLRIIVGVLMDYSEEKIASLYMSLASLTKIKIENKKATLELFNK